MMAAMKQQPQETMSLKEILKDFSVVEFLPDVEVSGITLDSRKVKPGFIFVAIEGRFDHGLAYAEAAVERGAVAILCDADFDQYCQQILAKLMTKIMCVPVKNLQRKLAGIAARYYQYPKSEMGVIGVTGTDGKTSVTHFIAQALNTKSTPAAVIGTLGNGLVDRVEESSHTTPDVISVHEMLSGFYRSGADSVAMEVSSHGLDQGRVNEVEFEMAILTNLSRDHLDYHGDIDSYRKAKKKLFTESISHCQILNIDDDFGVELFETLKQGESVWLYGLDINKVTQSSHYACAENIVTHAQGMTFSLKSSAGSAEVKLALIGGFNVYNALACCCVLLQRGLKLADVVARLEKLHTVAGRMELIRRPEKPSVVIDYAHTPEALTQALENVRKHTKGKLVCVFGCGGDRDAGKRPLMAAAAERLSDVVIVTNDNPRNESAEQIIDDIRQGFKKESGVVIEPERARAIEQAISMSTKDDVVLLAGKGHEEYQLIGNQKIPFSDRQVALACLEGDA